MCSEEGVVAQPVVREYVFYGKRNALLNVKNKITYINKSTTTCFRTFLSVQTSNIDLSVT